MRSYLEHGEIERAWETLTNYFDATHSLFGEQEELRVLDSQGESPAAQNGGGLLSRGREIQNTNQLMSSVGTKIAVTGPAPQPGKKHSKSISRLSQCSSAV